ncbi:EsaB/YukD family protein [Paenibacillus harenae]|uniref:Uncharacterized protein n=1 Tax=Paenibacillus harenae TaxID=306543 RepID=A0ABT9TVC7_PAEHA|nr:EsaB/YukD family protein [Paenibacillus harenae]MDQ0110663.1 hypothetical protein [Paenibacillus harenae]
MGQHRTMATVVVPVMEYRRDMELPSNVPVRQLSTLIAHGITKETESAFINGWEEFIELRQQGEEWKTLDPERTLEEQSVYDGAYLRVHPKA